MRGDFGTVWYVSVCWDGGSGYESFCQLRSDDVVDLMLLRFRDFICMAAEIFQVIVIPAAGDADAGFYGSGDEVEAGEDL